MHGAGMPRPLTERITVNSIMVWPRTNSYPAPPTPSHGSPTGWPAAVSPDVLIASIPAQRCDRSCTGICLAVALQRLLRVQDNTLLNFPHLCSYVSQLFHRIENEATDVCVCHIPAQVLAKTHMFISTFTSIQPSAIQQVRHSEGMADSYPTTAVRAPARPPPPRPANPVVSAAPEMSTKPPVIAHERAATKIQAMWRGHKSRQATQEQMDSLLHEGKILAELPSCMAWKMV